MSETYWHCSQEIPQLYSETITIMYVFRITKSKLREELLALYFTSPNKKYYLRELEKWLNFSVGNIRRELIKLENTGLFLIENKGNLVYYYLNQSYPLFEELKSIIFKTSGAPKYFKIF